MYRYSAERVLYFRKSENTNAIIEDRNIMYTEYLELLKLKNITNIQTETVSNLTDELRILITPLVPNEIEKKISIMNMTARVKLPLRKINFNSIKIISSNLILEDSIPVGIPINDTVYKWQYNNNGDLEQSFDQDFVYQHRTGFSLEFTKTIESEVSIGGELNYSGTGWGSSANFSKRVTTTIQNRRSYNEEKVEFRTGNDTFKVAPNSKTTVTLTIQQFESGGVLKDL